MPIGTIMQEGSLRGRIQLQETLHGIVAVPSSVGSANWNEIADKPFSTLDENTLFVENNILKVNTTEVDQLKSDLANLENLLIQIQDKLNQGTVVDHITVNEINDMIVSYFENKTVLEVEG